MQRVFSRSFSLFAVAALAITLVAMQSGLTASAGGNGTRWAAPLSASQEVAEVDSNGTGVATFKLSKDGDSISYKLNVANIDNVVASHIHLAPAEQNGPVVAFLFGPAPGGVNVNGTLAEGTITAADLIGPLSGMSIDDLVAAMESGGAYVNVHTVVNPGGEIRGQIK